MTKSREELIRLFSDMLGKENCHIDEPMKNHTTFRIGGAADYYLTPTNEEDFAKLIRFVRTEQIPYFVMGNGSNLLVCDDGFRGVVISAGRAFSKIEINGNVIDAQAGAMLSGIAVKAKEASLTGFEFAAGIPGTLGGACIMNAGAYGGEMKQVLQSVTCIDETGAIREVSLEEMELGYRSSIFMRKGWIVIGAKIVLQKGDAAEIGQRMAELAGKRREKQPLEYPSAGSTFKRPEGYFAGKLIMDAGLRGYCVGGAAVSEKHCGFVINKGDATAADVMNLIHDVQQRVKELFGVELSPEVRFLGDFQ